MIPTTPFTIVYDADALRHLKAIERRNHNLIRRAIETQLRFEPNVATRNRKPMVRSSRWRSVWELRCGPRNRFRVFYRVDTERRQVVILAIVEKVRSEFRIGGERFDP